MNERGFFSVDAIFAVTLLLMIATSFMNIYEVRMDAAERTAARMEARAIAEYLAGAIDAVWAAGENLELKINPPQLIVERYHYTVYFDNTERQIVVENSAWGALRVTIGVENVRMGDGSLYSSAFENFLNVRWGEGAWENWIVVE